MSRSPNVSMGLSRVVWTDRGDRLFTFEAAAHITETSVPLIEQYIELGLIEPVGVMISRQDLVRVIKLRRLRNDLGLNLVGAAMVLDMAIEISQLKAQLRAYQSAYGSQNS